MNDALKYGLAVLAVLASGAVGLFLFAAASFFKQPLPLGLKLVAWVAFGVGAAGVFVIGKGFGL